MTAALEQSFWIVVVLGAGLPLLSVTLTELSLRVRRRGLPLADPILLVRDLVLPAGAGLLALLHVAGWLPGSGPVRLAETILWLFATHTAMSFLSAFMFGQAREGTWQARMPKLFIDTARALIVLISLGVVLSTVWGQDLGQLMAALGVGSLVLGLALQEPVGNLFNGIMVMMERPIGISDWVRVDGHVGQVVDSNWRSIHLRTPDNDLVVVPNSLLAKASLTNFSRPEKRRVTTVKIQCSADDAPNRVKAALLESARRTRGVLANPGPKVLLTNFENSATEYEVHLPVPEYGTLDEVVEEFRTLVWYAARRDGLNMPYRVSRDATREMGAGPSEDALRAFPRLGLADTEVAGAMSGGVVQKFARGEQVVVEGQRLTGLYFIVRGSVRLSTRNEVGTEMEIARLERGEFFGKQSMLANSPSETTVTALEDLEVLLLESDSMDALIERAPSLARKMDWLIESRRKALLRVRTSGAAGPEAAARGRDLAEVSQGRRPVG